jgi:hypothetical protein
LDLENGRVKWVDGRTCGELVHEREGLIVRVGHCDDCIGDRIKIRAEADEEKTRRTKEEVEWRVVAS